MRRTALAALCALAFSSAAGAQEPDLSGRWSGYWVSDANGHTGPLHGRFRQIDAGTYRVSFRGRFAKVVPFWYTTKLRVEGTGDGVAVLGASQRLPLLGEYRTTAVATGTSFDAAFTSRTDSGRFVLTRR
ncbi:hypothetical protein [Gemmata sp.]|uniref:hypothetical protein n=1 Tax=Gemmata sp. TaxID=1914242 RepID=UPI003F723FED